MDPAARIVTTLPLAQIWDARGTMLAARRTRELGSDDVKELLRSRPNLKLIVADVGSGLKLIEPTARFTFWKDELAPHLAEPSSDALEITQFPGSYFYIASEWSLPDGEAIVVAEKHH
jgi:hypothetical protein